jgi:hypothetical protein
MFFKKQLQPLFNNTQIKLFAAFIVVLYLAGLVLWQSTYLKITDPTFHLATLDPSLQRNSSLVTVGLHVSSFPQFSFSKNMFTFDGILWFKFPVGTESLHTIEQFDIQNATMQQSGTMLFKSKPIIKIIGSDVMISYHIQANIKTALDYKNFPLSPHRLNIIINNKSVTPRELYFVSNDNNISVGQDSLVYSWTPYHSTVSTGYVSAHLAPKDSATTIDYPVAVFAIDFDNVGVRDLISLYFPMLVLFLIALFCLLIDITDTARLGYVAAAVPILVLFRMVIDGVSPDVGNLTHVDFMYNLFVFLALVILFFQTYVILRLQRIKEVAESTFDRTINHLSFWNNILFFGILLIIAIGSTISFWR